MQQSSAVAAGSSAGSTNNSPMNATFGSSHTNISRVLSQEEDMSSLSPRPLTIRNGLLLPLLLYNLLAAIEDSGGPLGRGKVDQPPFYLFFQVWNFLGMVHCSLDLSFECGCNLPHHSSKPSHDIWEATL